MKKKFLVITSSAILISFLFSACKPGYKEIWEPVEEYHMEWNEETAENDTLLIKSRLVEGCLEKEYSNIKSDIKKDEKYNGKEITNEMVIAFLDKKVASILDEQKPDGSLNIDYFSEEKNYWRPIDHLKKVLVLQAAYLSKNSKYYNDSNVKKSSVLSMEYWVKNDFHCDWNNWYNNIGIGMYIPDILLTGLEGMAEKDYKWLLEKIQSTLLQNSLLRFKIYERKVNESGGNLTDQVLSTLKVAVLENDYNTMMWLKSLLENELRPFPPYKGKNYHRWDAEGIKEDYSFQQHDQLIYFGGYGEVLLSGLTRYLQYTRNTQFELNKKSLDFYADFLVEGIQFATRNGYRDISASGRGIAREGGAKGIWNDVKNSAKELLEYAERDKVSDLQKEKLQNLMKTRFNGEKDLGALGHRYFYESDYNVYNHTNYMATVRHASKNTRIFEYLNGENPLAYYTGFGSTFYYVDGNEYEDIFPVYDWNKIPGTTTRQGKVPKMNQDLSYGTYGKTNSVSGVSNGKVGMSYFKQNAREVYGNKAYFMFYDGVVCLGSGITNLLLNNVVTSINQCNLVDSVYVGQNGKDTLIEDDFKGNADFIYHNKISYISENPVELNLEYGKSGDFKTIDERRKSKPIEKDLFTLQISHGKLITNKSYNYTVLLNTDINKTKKYIENPTLKIIENSKKIQAVYDENAKILQAVFHKKGSITVNNTEIKVNKPCVLIVELFDEPQLTISSYNSKEYEVCVTINHSEKYLNVKKAPLSESFK